MIHLDFDFGFVLGFGLDFEIETAVLHSALTEERQP